MPGRSASLPSAPAGNASPPGDSRPSAHESRVAILQALGTTFLWSITPTLVKLTLPHFDPFAIAFLRYALATTFLLGMLAARGDPWRPPRGVGGLLALGGLGAAFNYFFQIQGLRYTTASASSFIIQWEGVALLLIGWAVLGERWTRAKAWGSLVCSVGVFLVGWNGEPWAALFNSSTALGNGMVFLAGLSWSVYAACQKAITGRVHPLHALTTFFMVASVFTGAAWIGLGAWPHAFPLWPTLGVVFMGVMGTGFSYVLLALALRHMDAGTAGMWTTPLPVLSAVIAWWVLHERPSVWTWTGGALTLIGLLILSREE